MSERLVVEFYESLSSSEALCAVLAFHGGNNPVSAALTITDFFNQVSRFDDPRFDNASILAARFVAWQGAQGRRKTNFDFSDVAIIQPQDSYNYQSVRIYAQAERPFVHIVMDQYATPDELLEAAAWLQQPHVNRSELQSR